MQQELPIFRAFTESHYDVGDRSSGLSHGVVMTRRHIVELILDLAGYTSDRPLHKLPLVEPSCGHGAFVAVAVDRLLISSRRLGIDPETLGKAICAIEVDAETLALARENVRGVLLRREVAPETAEALLDSWFKQGDFLFQPLEPRFVFAVGNPPYVRIEQIHRDLQREYRAKYSTLYDRADLYVAFIERSLRLLTKEGRLSFICADRWTNNKYGKVLRKLVTTEFCTDAYVRIEGGSPFEEEVTAYPSIFLMRNGVARETRVFTIAGDDEAAAADLVVEFEGSPSDMKRGSAYGDWFKGEEPWTLTGAAHRATLRLLEERFPTLESGSTSVSIGIATGADKVFVVPSNLDVEPSRLVPVVMRRDIKKGVIEDAQRSVINTFDDDGKLIRLEDFPKLAEYFAKHEAQIRKRHVAKKSPSWFRTIDKLHQDLRTRPKLLIPDIAGATEVALDEGRFYPHHNLYFVTSEEWDMEVLGGLLSSRVALFFIWSYATKMRGGYLRFQAQYLRRIRVPRPESISSTLCAEIAAAFRARDFQDLDRLSLAAYGLNKLPEFDFVDTRS